MRPSQKIYSALGLPWQCFHVFNLSSAPATSAKCDTWRRLVTATNGTYSHLPAPPGLNPSARHRLVDQLLAAHFPPYQVSPLGPHLAPSWTAVGCSAPRDLYPKY